MSRRRLLPGMPAVLAPQTMAGRLAVGGIAWIGVWGFALLLVFNVLLSSVLANQVDASLRARAEAVAATIRIGDGRLVVAAGDDEALDAGTSIYLGGTLVEGIDLSPALRAELLQRGPATADRELLGPVRYLGYPIRSGGRQIGTIVVSSDVGAGGRTRWIVGGSSLVFIILMLVFTFFALRATVTRAMRPVRAMGDQASAWSDQDIDRRFDPHAGPAELRRLATTLNALLERISATLRHERDFTAELSHELRTPLAHLHAELDLFTAPAEPGSAPMIGPKVVEQEADLPSLLTSLMTSVRRLEALVESALVPARAAAGPSAAPGLSRLGDVLGELPRPPSAELVLDLDPDLLLAIEADIARRALLPLLENAFRYARGQVRIEARTRDTTVHLRVRDDGGRLDPAQAETVFQPGFRAEPGDDHPGAGLGLALSRRIARSAGGDVTAALEDGWTTLTLTFPYIPGAEV